MTLKGVLRHALIINLPIRSINSSYSEFQAAGID